MSASFYDLLKYAKTGIASPEMTAYDKMRAMAAAGGGAIKTLTGVPPLSFKANGKPLISWSMKGNGQQTGTPSPDNIIMPTFCGVRTGQMIPYPFYSRDGEYSGVQFTTYNGRIVANGTLTSGLLYYLWCPKKFPVGTYTMSVKGKHSGAKIYFRDVTNGVSVAYIYGAQAGDMSVTFTLAEEINAMVYINAVSGTVEFDCTIMLNAGEEALPYEPFGYKIPITCAGQTVPVYLGQTQTVRRIKKLVLTGTMADGNTSITPQGIIYITPVATLKSASNEYCTHYKFVNQSQGSSMPLNSFTTSGGAGKSLWFKTEFDNVEDFKAYLAAQYAAGTPVTVWYVLAEPETAIVNEPLAKIGEYADELHSEDAGVTIPTVKGDNTLTVDTDLKPSEMTITYCG